MPQDRLNRRAERRAVEPHRAVSAEPWIVDVRIECRSNWMKEVANEYRTKQETDDDDGLSWLGLALVAPHRAAAG
jgi:hypothetical protein